MRGSRRNYLHPYSLKRIVLVIVVTGVLVTHRIEAKDASEAEQPIAQLICPCVLSSLSIDHYPVDVLNGYGSPIPMNIVKWSHFSVSM
ncbi:hypothetical protein TNCV_134061 [Trichonephila clavipes]|nr:hypothetical protein TNCV_134061 [Trichonephila clavipes]